MDRGFHVRNGLIGWVLWLCLFMGIVVGGFQSRFSPSFHDLGGGRIPVSDGAAWFVGSVRAIQGVRTGWVARRPLNVSFNAPIIALASRIASDPLVMTLQIKRTVAYAGIAALVLAVEGCFSIITRLGIGMSLLAVVFSNKASGLSFLLGSGLGYTHGTELNAFIFIVSGVAALVVAARHVDRFSQRRALIPYLFGILLVAAGCQMRPGTLFLIPLIVLLFAAVYRKGLAAKRLGIRELALGRFRPFLLATVVGLGGALLLQQLAFNQVTDACGAIGGNQGLSLYGLSRGLDWNAGRAYQQKFSADCEKTANSTLKKEGLREFRRNPQPALSVIADNLYKNNNFISSRSPGRRSWFVLMSSLLLVVWLLRSGRIAWHEVFSDPRAVVVLLGSAGWISMELFIVVLFRDSYLRPLIPYAVFPILSIWGLLDHLIERARRLPLLTTRFQYLSVVSLSCLLVIQLLLGNLVLAVRPLLVNHVFPSLVRGQFPLHMDELHKIGVDTWMFNLGLPENYRIATSLPVELSQPGVKLYGRYCLSYSRRRLPDTFDHYGTIDLSAGPCRP